MHFPTYCNFCWVAYPKAYWLSSLHHSPDIYQLLQVGELYDEASLKAVLEEWLRTFSDLPLMIRQSVELGLFSSAQLVRFLSMDVRPGITRKVTRVLSPKVLIAPSISSPCHVHFTCLWLQYCRYWIEEAISCSLQNPFIECKEHIKTSSLAKNI